MIECVGGLIIAYLIGSFPTSFILAKLVLGIDIRQSGSGNVGATNVLRTVGKLPALIALIADILKGSIVILLISPYLYKFTPQIDPDLYRVILGLMVIGGHIWPVFLKFKGGKGVATTIGVTAVLAPKLLLVGIMVWLIVYNISHYVSVASLFFGAALPVFSFLLYPSVYIFIFAVTVCVLNTYKHKSNIERLSKGIENRTYIFKKR